MKSILTAILTVTLTVLLYSNTIAHDWYDAKCCSGSDCRPTECSRIKYNERGKVTHDGIELLDQKNVLPSKDDKCHVCIPHSVPRCIYIPNPVGS